MMKRKTFTFRNSWFEAMRNLPDNTRLALMDAICSYAIEGKLPENLEMTAQTAFILIRAEIDNTPAPRKKNETGRRQAVRIHGNRYSDRKERYSSGGRHRIRQFRQSLRLHGRPDQQQPEVAELAI